MGEPETYWEERCALLEDAVTHLANIVLNGNPMLHTSLQRWADEWTRLRNEIHQEHEFNARSSEVGAA